MSDILEPEGWSALPREKIDEVLNNEEANYRHILNLHSLKDFTKVKIEKDNIYQED